MASPASQQDSLLANRYLIPMVVILAVLLGWNFYRWNEKEPIIVNTDPRLLTSESGAAGAAVNTAQPAINKARTNVLQSHADEDRLKVAAVSPAMQRSFPESLPGTGGGVYQLGVYNRLDGAESAQSSMLRHGLNPHIDKRLSATGTRYIVMLGPYSDSVESRRVRQILDREEVVYFLRITK